MNKKILKKSVIGMDFLSAIALKMEQPSIDEFLDYRSFLMKSRDDRSVTPKSFIHKEIAVVDEILKYLNK